MAASARYLSLTCHTVTDCHHCHCVSTSARSRASAYLPPVPVAAQAAQAAARRTVAALRSPLDSAYDRAAALHAHVFHPHATPVPSVGPAASAGEMPSLFDARFPRLRAEEHAAEALFPSPPTGAPFLDSPLFCDGPPPPPPAYEELMSDGRPSGGDAPDLPHFDWSRTDVRARGAERQ